MKLATLLSLLILSIGIAAGCTREQVQPVSVQTTQTSYERLDAWPDAKLDWFAFVHQPNRNDWKLHLHDVFDKHPVVYEHLVRQLYKLEVLDADQLDIALSVIVPAHVTSSQPEELFHLIELTAYADISCHMTENWLRFGVFDCVRANLEKPGVKQMLEWIQVSYECKMPESEVGYLRDGMETRVREYATELLNETS